MVPSRGSLWVVPSEAPEKIRDAITVFRRAAADDPQVVASFIGGSYATATWDEHSDLDLYLIVADDHYHDVLARRLSFLETMGRVVLAEDFDEFGFDMVVFMLANGVEGELGFARRTKFLHIHVGAYGVLEDPGGLLDGVTFPRQRPTPEQRIRSLQRTVAWFWRQLSLFATAAARGRSWTAYGYLEQARREAVDLVWWMDAPDSWPGGYEKLEVHLNGERLSAMATTLVGLDTAGQWTAAESMAEFMAQDGRSACAAAGCRYPDLLEATVRTKLGSLRH